MWFFLGILIVPAVVLGIWHWEYFLVFLCVASLFAFFSNWYEKEKHRRKLSASEAKVSEIQSYARRLGWAAGKHFRVHGCPRCYETSMRVNQVSPNAKSIEYQCRSCGKKMRAVANSENAREVLDLIIAMSKSVEQYMNSGGLIAIEETETFFTTPERPLPHK